MSSDSTRTVDEVRQLVHWLYETAATDQAHTEVWEFPNGQFAGHAIDCDGDRVPFLIDGYVLHNMGNTIPDVWARLAHERAALESNATERDAIDLRPIRGHNAVSGCASCGTEDTGRFRDGDAVCVDCRARFAHDDALQKGE